MMKKVFRVFGYVVCGLLIVLCILMIVSASVFGASKTVSIFGANVYVVENNELPTAPEGSAVLVKKCGPSDLEPGNPVLYLKSDENDEPVLGYVNGLAARDGVYYITVEYKDGNYEFPESKLVGLAKYSSSFWGGVIRFIKTPVGVMVIAVLPCAALILFELIRISVANRPEPEVIPKVKNADEPPHTDVKLSVDKEGKALYAKDRTLKPLPKDNDVLFDYSGRQKGMAAAKPAKAERPIIPLTDKKPTPEPEVRKVPESTGKLFDVRLPSVEETAADAKPEPISAPGVKERSNVREKTAELPTIPSKKANGDAFFAQPSVGRQLAPQIGRQRRPQPPKISERVLDDIDDREPRKPLEESAPHVKPERAAGKRSTQILASKSFDDLLSDDDDVPYSRSSSDKAVDDILAGIDRRK